MKCYNPTCSIPHTAEYVKIFTDEESCAAHLPDGAELRAFLEGTVESFNGWVHVDGAWKCCACELYYVDDDAARWDCSQCSERACDGCLDDDLVCQGCRDRNEERADVRDVIRRA